MILSIAKGNRLTSIMKYFRSRSNDIVDFLKGNWCLTNEKSWNVWRKSAHQPGKLMIVDTLYERYSLTSGIIIHSFFISTSHFATEVKPNRNRNPLKYSSILTNFLLTTDKKITWLLSLTSLDQFMFLGKLATYPSPNLTFWPKREVSVNVRFGEG